MTATSLDRSQLTTRARESSCDTLQSGEPCVVARLGSSEVSCVSYKERWRSRFPRPGYPAALRGVMANNAGVFPVDDASLDRFADVFTDAMAAADVMGVWFNRGEDVVAAKYCPQARLVHLEAMNPLLTTDPWTALLEGRSVLVVHPFAHTIAAQYRDRRPLLFSDARVLPQFELTTIASVQSGAGQRCAFPTWFDALDHMCGQVAAAEFDIAIVGAGAYGLPLAAAIKDMGKQAVHLGGATQLLFGIRGRRWEREYSDSIAPYFNEHWTRPSDEETPSDSDKVEGGCYW